MKKKVLIMAAGTIVTLVLAGCGGTTVRPGDSASSAEESDSGGAAKSSLTIATYDGGVGSDWIKEAATRFEKKYAETSFEEGKKGVNVRVLANKAYNGVTLISSSLTADLYYTEDVSYFEHINKGNFADITDIVTTPLTEFGETGTIKDKLDTQYAKYLTAKDGKYYAIPFYDGIYGIIYDVDLFTEKNFFFAADGASSRAPRRRNPRGRTAPSAPPTMAFRPPMPNSLSSAPK